MLTMCILFSLLILFFYGLNKYKKESKELVLLITLYSLSFIWGLYMIIDYQRTAIYILILILCILCLSLYYIFNFSKDADSRKIYAKQQNYWGIDKEEVINTFSSYAIEKSDRIEVPCDKNELYIYTSSNKTISPNTISYLKNMNKNYCYTYVKNIDEIKKYPLKDKIFNKLLNYIEIEKEIFINYNDTLNKLENNLDFFLIYLWSKYTKEFNIGIGQLETLVINDSNDREFINALDNINLNVIKLNGSYLLYKYKKFMEKKDLNNE